MKTFSTKLLSSVIHPGKLSCQLTETDNRNTHNLLLIGNKSEFVNIANSMNIKVYFIIPNNPLMYNSKIRSHTIINEISKLNVSSIVFHSHRSISFGIFQ